MPQLKSTVTQVNWLYPDKSIDEVANTWLAKGAELVVITFGDKVKVKIRKVNIEKREINLILL